MSGRFAPARDPLRRALPAELVESFAPLGVPLHVETNSAEVLEACRVSFGAFGRPRAEDGAPLVLRLLVDPSFDETAPWPEPIFRARDHIFYVCVGRQSTAVADLAAGSAVGFVAPALARETRLLRRTFIDCLVLTLLTHGAAARRSYVHASAAARSGRGLLFSGPSGAGKSTLALGCLRRGFDLVSDDVVYLEDAGELIAWGKPSRLRLLPEGVRLFPELDSVRLDAPSDGDDSLELDVETHFPGRTRMSCGPEAILFLERSLERPSGPPRLREVEPEAALELLSRDLIQDEPEALERHRRVWLRLARRGAFRFELGPDLDGAIDLLERFVDARRR